MMESSQAADLTPDERFGEIAYILAMGIVRSHGRSASAPDNRPNNCPNRRLMALRFLRKRGSVCVLFNGLCVS